MRCENCCYYGYSHDEEGNATTTYMHCCFSEWGHSDYEVAPCDDPDYDDDNDEEEYYDWGFESNMPCDNTGYCAGTSCSRFFECQGK